MGRHVLVWDDATVQEALGKFDEKVTRAIIAGCQRNAPKLEAWAKVSAPWTDQTGNARNGIQAVARPYGTGARITLSHGVPYGIFLEVRNGGKNGVIPQAIDAYFPETFHTIMRLLEL